MSTCTADPEPPQPPSQPSSSSVVPTPTPSSSSVAPPPTPSSSSVVPTPTPSSSSLSGGPCIFTATSQQAFCQWGGGCYAIDSRYGEPAGQTCQYYVDMCSTQGQLFVGVTGLSESNNYGENLKCANQSGTAYNNSGTFTDSRDSKVYKWVKIGTQTWMGENLNYTPTSGNSKCPDNTSANCTKYGRQYDWATAMGLTSSYNSTFFNMPNSKRQGVCPTGWHLPSRTEWSTLVNYVGTNPGTKLKATTGWPSGRNGTDNFGFKALPGGYVEYGSVWDSYNDVGTSGYWWTATEYNADYAYDKMMGGGTSYTSVYDYGQATNNYSWTKRDMLSVRCIKD